MVAMNRRRQPHAQQQTSASTSKARCINCAHVQFRRVGRDAVPLTLAASVAVFDGGCRRGLDHRHRPVAHHRAAEPGVRGEYAVIEDQVDSRPRDEGGKAPEKVQRVEDEVARAVRPRRLQLEHDPAVLAEPEPILRDRRPEHVAAELLQALTILPIHSDIAVEIEAVQMGVARSTGADPLCLRVSSQGHQPRARPRAQRYASLHRRAAETRQRQRVLPHRVGPRYVGVRAPATAAPGGYGHEWRSRGGPPPHRWAASGHETARRQART